MKFIIDERVKHRLIGLLVILSMAVIFVPSIIKKSNHHFEENINLSVHLPPKPKLPQVAIGDRKALFNTVKIVKRIEPVPIKKVQEVQIAKAQPLKLTSRVPNAPVLTQPIVSKEQFVIQLASFNSSKRAEILVEQLRKKGYVANYYKSSGAQGPWFKVMVGPLPEAQTAKTIQKKLAESMRLNGFVVKTKVS